MARERNNFVMELKKFLDYSLVEAHLKKMSAHLQMQSQELVLDVVLMEGARYFYEHLTALGDWQHDCLEMNAKSYVGTRSTGTVSGLELNKDIRHYKTINIFDDLCDTGLTLLKVSDFLRERAGSGTLINLYTLFNKPSCNNLKLSFPSIDVPAKFIVGCGLDYNGEFRDLDGLYELILSNEK